MEGRSLIQNLLKDKKIERQETFSGIELYLPGTVVTSVGKANLNEGTYSVNEVELIVGASQARYNIKGINHDNNDTRNHVKILESYTHNSLYHNQLEFHSHFQKFRIDLYLSKIVLTEQMAKSFNDGNDILIQASLALKKSSYIHPNIRVPICLASNVINGKDKKDVIDQIRINRSQLFYSVSGSDEFYDISEFYILANENNIEKEEIIDNDNETVKEQFFVQIDTFEIVEVQ